LPGYDPDVRTSRAEARQIMEKLGYGPERRLDIKVSTRDISYYRDPAVILIDQLKDIYINGELEPVETTQWYPKVMRKDYTVGLNITETGVDDPDVLYYENYVCGAARNYTGYCNPQVDKLVDRQSMETDRPGAAQNAGVGDRKEIGRGRRPANPLLPPRHDLLAAAGEGADDHGQQYLQRLALRRPLAR
jgi:ABC-type transport system substrate-binding protein